ncbi:hypothetical protein [Enterobacter cloacae complex sp. 357B1]|uniref:hypothetical protein n=1 Tax=Enterobacter cloacae complex sp. 357B1 TaxID=3395827 RepID=UPI003CEDB5CE
MISHTMPVLLFFYLLVFKESVDPDSSQIEQIRHIELLQAIWLSTGNIKKEDIPKFSIYELDSLNIISNKTLAEQQAERGRRRLQNNKKQTCLIGWE